MAGACETDETRRRMMAERHGLARTFASCQEMLAGLSPDVVIVGTPPSSHYTITGMALEAGAHVLCEKPFMTSLDEADRVIATARQRNLLLRVNNQYRFMEIYRETRERLERGEFGRLFHVQCWQQMFHPPASEANWRRDLRQYVLFEFATHALDLIAYFYGDTPEAVSMFTPRCRPEFDADVVVAGILRFPGDRLAVVNFNRVTQAPEKYLEMRLDCERASLRLSLGGVARVAVEWSKRARRPVWRAGLVKGGQARVESGGRSRVYASAARSEFAPATAAHLRLFLEQMRQPERPLKSALEARLILEVVFQGYESARTGETVHLR